MVCKEEVFSWFQSLTSPKRIEFLCGLLDFCHPIELRFLGTCLEELCRKDYNFLRDSEQKANNTHELQSLDDIGDDTVRTKLIVYLALLYTTNSQGSNVLSHTLNHVESTILNGLQLTEQIKEEFLLLLAMAANHPAFSIHQRLTFSTQMERIQAQPTVEVCKGSSAEHRKEEEEVISEETSTTPGTQPSTDTSKETQQPKVYVRSIEVKGCKKTGGRERGCVYTMQVSWSDGTLTTVNRTYRDLCDFQCKLQNLFPDETGANRSKGIIPHLPGKAGETGKRDIDMENYVRQLVSLPRHILESDHVTSFFGHQQYHHPYPSSPAPAGQTPNNVQDGVDECRRPWSASEPGLGGGSHQHHCPTSIPTTCHDAAGSTAGSPHSAPEMPSPVNDHKAGMPLQIPMVHGTTMPTHVSYQCPRQARFYKHTYASLRTSSPAPSTSALPMPLPSPHETFLPSPPPTSPRNLELLLKEIRLHKYYGQLKDFRMEQIMGMTDEDLANLGLTEGARRKLKIHLDAVQNPAYRAVLGPKNKTTCAHRKGPMNGLHVDIPIHQATAVVTGPMPVMPPPSPIQTPPPNYPPTVQPMPHQNLLHMQSLPSNSGDSSSSECCSSPTPSSPRHEDKESSESSDEEEKDEYPPRQVANAWRNPPHNRRASLHHPSQQRPPPPPPPPPPFCHVETQHRSHWTHRQPHMGRMDKGFPPNRPYAIPIVPNAVPQMGHGSDQSPVPPLQSPLDGRIIPTVNATAVIATTQVENRTQGNSLRPNVSSFQPQLMSPQAESFPHTTLTLPSTITTVSVATTGFTMFPPQGKCAVIPPSANEIVTIGKGTVTFVSTTTSPNPETHFCSTKALTNPTQTVAQTVPSKGESKEASSKTEESSEGSAKGTTTVTYANPTLQNAVNMTSESSPSPSTSTTPSNPPPPPPPPPSSSHNGPHSRGCSNCGCSGNCGSSSGSNYTFNYPGYLHPNNMNSPFPFHFGHYFPNLGGNGLIGIPPPSNIPSYASFPHIPPLQFPNGLNPANMYNFQGSYGHLPPNYMHPGLMLQGGQGMFPMGSMGKGKGSQTCYNCGATGHTARECKDSTMEQMSAQGMFRLKYQPPEPLDTTD
ncbi:uncharacterized protein LOC144919937 isoform X2 [Branchiostoma floridae x Branchiostoma belcheri]